MRNLIIALVILLPIVIGCNEDEDRIIQTDLTAEAAELFSISNTWNESLYFALIPWEEYVQMGTVGSVKLPSCPDIFLNEESREVTLQFPASTECTQSGTYARSGKLIIRFDTTLLSPAKKWTMEYDAYKFRTNTIEGIRTFTGNDSLQVLEEFNEITEKTENKLSSTFSGKLIHTKTYANDSVSSFTSLGRIQGTNAAGRNFEITLENPINHFISCYHQNEILPSTGMENWFVSRKGNSQVSYGVTYEPQIDGCKVSANATLPDGRKFLLNPTE
ncbi:hypothetical protein J2X69_001842 [Algoriphagus sp. 4150]|uniref:hypothetical protein n=1 Tax=Algoriphagus sp. 4150 TaxID=2817756 RepID=UPI002864D7C6|nr:hypothetical protein [Algoriphagus sp. 4150]MDR7129505.1 hypothetical protein [Algoriphagus sp. 4150]